MKQIFTADAIAKLRFLGEPRWNGEMFPCGCNVPRNCVNSYGDSLNRTFTSVGCNYQRSESVKKINGCRGMFTSLKSCNEPIGGQQPLSKDSKDKDLVILDDRNNSWRALSLNKTITRKPFSGWNQEIVMLWEIDNGDTWDIRRNTLHQFTEPSMELPCWCTFVVHQYGVRKRVLTAGTYFAYLGDRLSVLSKQAFNFWTG